MRKTAVIQIPKSFRALVSREKKALASLETLQFADLPKTYTIKQMSKTIAKECDTILKVEYSTLNYKDAMVVTGNYPGLKYPMIGGIDMVGTVLETSSKLNIGV